MAKIVPEIEFMLSSPKWLKHTVGEDPQIFGPQLAWAAMLAALNEFPGEPPYKLVLAAICANAVTRQNVLGFCAGLAVMDKLRIALPPHGLPGFVGAPGHGGDIDEAKDCWDRSKDHFVEIANELDAYDQIARDSIRAILQRLEIPSQSHDKILDVSVGFESPAKPRTPTRSGFISAFAWKRYVEDPVAPVADANRRGFELLNSYLRQQASIRGNEHLDPSMPNPFPRDFRCSCGEDLDRYLFCCDPSRLYTRADLAEVHERTSLPRCEECGDSLSGFNCDGCGAANCWVFGVVDSHRNS